MKGAIIGLGVIAEVHIEVLKNLKIDVCCVCDIDRDKAEKFVAQHKISSKIYTDYKEMLDLEKVDVVHICTPHYLHADMVIELLGRNINVLCEKPLCIKKSDIPRILEAERSSSATLGVCHQNRYKGSVVYRLND